MCQSAILLQIRLSLLPLKNDLIHQKQTYTVNDDMNVIQICYTVEKTYKQTLLNFENILNSPFRYLRSP